MKASFFILALFLLQACSPAGHEHAPAGKALPDGGCVCAEPVCPEPVSSPEDVDCVPGDLRIGERGRIDICTVVAHMKTTLRENLNVERWVALGYLSTLQLHTLQPEQGDQP